MFKKKPQKPKQHDLAALDQAVSELSRQTEALLGSSDTSTPKPKLPKKQAHPSHKGKSFDIIHDPKKTRRIQATLKASKPAAKAVAHQDVELLPEHATASFNELEQTTQKDSEPAVADHAEEAVVIKGQHEEGSLIDKEGQKILDSADDSTNLNPPKEQPTEAEEQSKAAEVSSTKTAQTSISFTEDEHADVDEKPAPSGQAPEPELTDTKPKAADTPASESTDTPEPTQDSAEPTESEDSEESEDEEEPKVTSYTGELYANNLVKEVQPKGFKPSDDADGPAVFDTEQYHPDLHDWSKLENRHTNIWLLALLLAVVVGGVAYFVISGQKLPF